MRSSVATSAKLLAPIVGMSFFWPYFRASFLSFLTVLDVHSAPAVHVAYVAYVVTFALLTAVALLATPHVRQWLAAPHARIVLGTLGGLGNAVLWLPAPDSLATLTCVLGSAAATAFFVGSVLGYGTALASWDGRTAAVAAFASFGICFLDNLALASPVPIAALFCIGGPLACATCMPQPIVSGTATRPAQDRGRPELAVAPHGTEPQASPPPVALLALIVLLALFCLTGNVVRGLTNPWFSYNGPTMRSLYMSLANLVFAAISITLLARGVNARKVLFWNWTACMALFFAGLLALAFLPTPAASLGSDVATVSRVCFTLLMFLFALAAQNWTSIQPVRLLGLFLLLPEAISALVRHILVPTLLVATGAEPIAAASQAGVAIILILTVTIIIVLGDLLLRQINDPQQTASPDGVHRAAAPSTAPARNADTLEQIALTYGLTAREVQTASYVSQGYSLEKTAELLGISINTVRTHMRSVYGKLAIHSRQELIDLLDEQAAR